MKKQLLILFSFLLMHSVSGQEQWTMFSKVTATWCSNCGSWGWTMFEDALDATENDNVLAWTLHYSGDLRNPTAEAIADNFNAFAQPRFYINNDDIGVNSGNISNKIDELTETVNLLNSFAPFAAVDANAVYDGYKIAGDTQIEFLDDSPGNYYLGVYLVKDHIINPQANQGSMADHRFVLMDHFGDNIFGNMIVSPQGNAGDMFSENFTKDIEIDLLDVSDYYVVTVLWNQITDGSYRVFNLDVAQVEYLASNVVDESILSNYKIWVADKSVNIVPQTDSEYAVEIMTIDGKLIHEQKASGEINIPLNSVNESILVTRISSENKQASQRLFLK